MKVQRLQAHLRGRGVRGSEQGIDQAEAGMVRQSSSACWWRFGVLAILPLLAALAGCTICRHYGDLHGVLLDAADGQPVAGAAVVGVYHIEHGTAGGAVEERVDAGETTTDASGHFVLPGKLIVAPRMPLTSFGERRWIHIFAPGYESVDLTGEQAYSRIGIKKIPDGNGYREESRPLLLVIRTTRGQLYQFKVSRLDTDEARADNVNDCFIIGPSDKFPHYLRLLNAERARYALPEWRAGCPARR